MRKKRQKGFAVMDEEKVRSIAQLGGKSVSQDRQHMADIGRRGGLKNGKKTSKFGRGGV